MSNPLEGKNISAIVSDSEKYANKGDLKASFEFASLAVKRLSESLIEIEKLIKKTKE